MRTMRFGVVAAASLLMAGCTTYQDTSRKLDTGYYQDLQIQAEREKQLAQDDQIALQRDLSTLQQKQQDMTAEQLAASKQLAKIDSDLAVASKQLDAARNQNRVSRADYDKLKAELDALQLQQQSQTVAPAADAAEKQRQLQALQKKKDALQQAIKALGATS
jgi:septal ring factor EnvC (AmiA/AmiB activator)